MPLLKGTPKIVGTGPSVPPTGNVRARIAFVGFSPAREEARTGVPFTGASGRQLDRCLASAKIERSDVWITNLSQQQLPLGITTGDLDDAFLQSCKARLAKELSALPNLTTIVPLGESFSVLTGRQGITRWRGSILESVLLPGKRVVPTVHPAWIIRGQWRFAPVLTFDIKRAVEESAKPGTQLDTPVVPMLTGPSFRQAVDALDHYLSLPPTGLVSVDIEMHKRSFIACIGFYDGDRPAICIPFVYGNGKPIWTTAEEGVIWQRVAYLLEKARVRLCGQNFSFDVMRLLWENRISCRPPWMDTMHAHHCLMPELPHSLAFLTSIYTRHPYYKDDGRTWDPKIGETSFWQYNCRDVWVTWNVAQKLHESLQREKLWDVYVNCYVKRFSIALRMEYEGVNINTTHRATIQKDLEQDIDKLQAEVDGIAGIPLNVASPPQMKKYLYETKKYDPVISRTTHKITTNVDALRSLLVKYSDPIIAKIIELRQLRDLKGDIFDQPIATDNRMRCHYSQTGTETGGRWSSSASVTGSGTNLQNVPRRGPARRMFIPDAGHVFVAVDQVQAEAMAVAWMGPVPGLIRLFREGRDVHREVAAMICDEVARHGIKTGGTFGGMTGTQFLAREEKWIKDSEERYIAKRTVHASNYDMQARRHAMVTGIPVSLAEIVLQIYHRRLFPEIKSLYHEGIKNELRQNRTLIVPYFNTRRIFLDYWDDSGELLRAAYAHKPQALVGHITGRIMELCEVPLLDMGAHIRMQVHDEIIVSSPESHVDDVCKLLRDAALTIQIPLPGGILNIPVSYKVGPSYGELKDYAFAG